MKSWLRISVMWLAAVMLLALVACSERDGVISVADDDPEMTAAIAKARSTLPQFWQTFEKPGKGEEGFALKVAITDPNGTEHFWANKIERQDGKIFGVIDNTPNIVGNVKIGDRIEIPEANISDWLYARDGKMVGNETVRPLFKQMSKAEVARFKSMMAEP